MIIKEISTNIRLNCGIRTIKLLKIFVHLDWLRLADVNVILRKLSYLHRGT